MIMENTEISDVIECIELAFKKLSEKLYWYDPSRVNNAFSEQNLILALAQAFDEKNFCSYLEVPVVHGNVDLATYSLENWVVVEGKRYLKPNTENQANSVSSDFKRLKNLISIPPEDTNIENFSVSSGIGCVVISQANENLKEWWRNLDDPEKREKVPSDRHTSPEYSAIYTETEDATFEWKFGFIEYGPLTLDPKKFDSKNRDPAWFGDNRIGLYAVFKKKQV